MSCFLLLRYQFFSDGIGSGQGFRSSSMLWSAAKYAKKSVEISFQVLFGKVSVINKVF